ncbi:MAG: RluA family pseudouridine synthase, partial [Bacteroidota bacterium]
NAEDRLECVDLALPPPEPYRLSLEVVYEDDWIAVVNKPSGLVVSGNQFRTLENALLHNLLSSKQPDALRAFRTAHRLDAPTSGLVLIAKTASVRVELGKLFEERRIHKRYQAIVIGKTAAVGDITSPIEQKEAYSKYECVKCVPSLRNQYLSLLNLYPTTGRTHQLRIHLASIGHPIMGDKQYGKAGEIMKHKGLFLAAVALEFQHPITTEHLQITIDMPHKFKSLLTREERRWHNWQRK